MVKIYGVIIQNSYCRLKVILIFISDRSRYRDKNAQQSTGGSFNRNSYGDARGDSRSGGGNRSGGFSGGGRGHSGRGGHSNRNADSRGDKGGYGGRHQPQQNGSWSHMGGQQNSMMGGGYNSYGSTYSQHPPPPPPPGPPPSQPSAPQPLMQHGQQPQYTQQASVYQQTAYQPYQPQATNAVQGQIQQAAAWAYPQQT